MEQKVEVLVSVDDAHLEKVHDVAEELRSAGMDVHEALPELGTISGAVELDRMAKLEGVPGVAGLERGREVSIPPPDADVQ